MQSNAKDVENYMQEVTENRQESLGKLRKLCLNTLVGYEESMLHGMPSYNRADEEVEIAFASQKKLHLVLYPEGRSSQ